MLTVDAPPLKPMTGGLLSVANVVPDPQGRTGYEGVRFLGHLAGPAKVVPAPGTPKEFERQAVVQGVPFKVYRGVETNLFEQFDVQALADEVFTAGETLAAEAALQPVLNGAAQDVTPTPGTPVGVVDGVAILEEWIAERYGGLPLLHMSRYGATHTSSKGLLRPDGTDLVTFQGTPIANGAGYGNTGPGGVVATYPGRYWVYVTGQVTLYQGPLVKAEATDHTHNHERALVERTYVPVVDGPVGAVLVQA